MKTSCFRFVFASVGCLLFSGCSTGYTKSNGRWTYITINEAVGRKVQRIDADMATFRVLEDPHYASDKNHVYIDGEIVEGLDGATFEFLADRDYTRDKNHVYYIQSIIVGADPKTFRLLSFPYGRDAEHIYYGNLRMNVEQPEDFRVLTPGEPRSSSWFRSTEDLVSKWGEEFADYEVLYEAKGENSRYSIYTGDGGTATDGVWDFEGPKRARRVQATPVAQVPSSS